MKRWRFFLGMDVELVVHVRNRTSYCNTNHWTEKNQTDYSYDGYGIKHADRRYDGYRRDIFLWVFACSTCAIRYNCFRSAVTRSFSLTTVPRGLDPEFTDSDYTVPLLALLTLEEIRTRWWSCWANFFDSAWTTTSPVTLHHNIYSKFALSHSKIPDTHLLCCHWEQRFSCWYRGNVVCSDRLPSGTVVLQENFLSIFLQTFLPVVGPLRNTSLQYF